MSAPPRFALALLRLLTPSERKAEVESDLMDAFEGWARTDGRRAAHRRLWKEMLTMPAWWIVGTMRRLKDVSSSGRAPRGNGPGEAGQDGPGGGWWDIRGDLSFALRRMVRTPGSTAIAILVLAIGVGGNATIYTLVDELLIAPPPGISEPARLVALDGAESGRSTPIPDFGYYDFEFFRANSHTLEDVVAYGGFPGTRGRTTSNGGEVSIGDGATRTYAQAWVVTSNFFQVLGVPPVLGSGFTGGVGPSSSSGPEVMLSHGFWQRTLGGDPAVLDKSLTLNGMPFQVVGVAPPEFRGVDPADRLPDVFIPIRSAGAISVGFEETLRRYSDDGKPNASRFLRVIARLAPGVDLASAQAEMEVLQGQWNAEFAGWSEKAYGGAYRFSLRPEFNLSPEEARQFRRILTLLWFVVGAVFLVACANLALLLLARAAGREREMGIRTALGAGRGRLLKQLLTENLVLALIGGSLGIWIAFLATDAASATLPIAGGIRFRPNATVMVFCIALSGLAAFLFGTAPAWMLSRLSVVAVLQRPGQGRAKALFRGILVASQTALSIVLLVVCGLFARSFQSVQDIDLGFARENRLLVSVELDSQGLPQGQGPEMVTQTMERLARVPGVVGVTTANRVPFLGSATGAVAAPGTPFEEAGLKSGLNLVGPDYFQVAEIPVTSGRGFSRDDGMTSERVAVVNEVFAERVWPGQVPLGRTIRLGGLEWTVVGVAKPAIYYSLTESPLPYVYIPQLQFYMGRMTFVLATRDSPLIVRAAVEKALREVNPDLPAAFLTMNQLVEEQLANARVWAIFVALFSGIALLLAMVGLYGVQSYLVSRRTREIGIRMALGAKGGSVVAGVVRGSLFIGGIGAVVGVGVAIAAAGLLRGFLFGVSPTDPLVMTAAPVLLILSCVVATVGPAVRASRVSPVEALSQE
jgi:predicted permease